MIPADDRSDPSSGILNPPAFERELQAIAAWCRLGGGVVGVRLPAGAGRPAGEPRPSGDRGAQIDPAAVVRSDSLELPACSTTRRSRGPKFAAWIAVGPHGLLTLQQPRPAGTAPHSTILYAELAALERSLETEGAHTPTARLRSGLSCWRANAARRARKIDIERLKLSSADSHPQQHVELAALVRR